MMCYQYLLRVKIGILNPTSKTLIKEMWMYQGFQIFGILASNYFYYKLDHSVDFITNFWWTMSISLVITLAGFGLTYFFTAELIRKYESGEREASFDIESDDENGRTSKIQKTIGIDSISFKKVSLFYTVSILAMYLAQAFQWWFRNITWMVSLYLLTYR
jgi:hypothetical protein